MAKLTAGARRKMKLSDFAGPARSYPIPDISHARNALARAGNASPSEQARIRAAVRAKFPSVK
jgi:hypothetical protein